ncbi:AzlC family ABC transporter permease [uncultured Marinococcus sp.]|uniref:AzlC family ABC transporter permease n=1 Tax=uncultured Marinococcus sp. TaxID=487012 RepID=UPI002607F51F|nr:AzlC family ABC transporter permease [uncultured Marinococcus sp.]
MSNTAALDHSWNSGLIQGLPIAAGYIPAALGFGLLGANSGLSIFETALMSIIIFSGAAQYMAIGLITAGAGLYSIWISTFLINIRHLLMSASAKQILFSASKWKQGVLAFGLTDEVFALISAKRNKTTANFGIGIFLAAYISWVIFSCAGYYFGAFFPGFLQISMDFALYALFAALLFPAILKYRMALYTAGLSAAVNTFLGLWLSPGWAIPAAMTASVIIVVYVSSFQHKKESQS